MAAQQPFAVQGRGRDRAGSVLAGLPHGPAGVEGWESMYPAGLLFGSADPTWERSAFWLRDALHHPGVKLPFESIVNEAYRLGKGQWSSRYFQLPGGYGTEQRILSGYVYLAPVALTDEEVRRQRTEAFAARAHKCYADWDSLYATWLGRVRSLIEETSQIAIPVNFPEAESAELIRHGSRGTLSMNVLSSYHRLVDNMLLIWQYHFELLTLGYGAYLNAVTSFTDLFPDAPPGTAVSLIGNADGAYTEIQRVIGTLALRAVDAGFANIILTQPYRGGLASLQSHPAGREWTGYWREMSARWFHVAVADPLSSRAVSWHESPEHVWTVIRQVIQGRRTELPGRAEAPERRSEDKMQLAQYLSLLASPEERNRLAEAVALASKVSGFVEHHSYFVENWFHLVFWEKMRDVGALCVAAGLTETAQDVFYLNRWEVAEALYEICARWSSGAPAIPGVRFAPLVATRKVIVDRLARWEAPAYLGTQPRSGGDPAIQMLFGTVSGPPAEPPTGELDMLKGQAASGGIAKGPVRIVHDEADYSRVSPGDILVAGTASPSWTGMFSIASALVTEVGGIMSHAAVVAREYRMPAVVGVTGALLCLGDGDQVTVDGDSGVVMVDGRAMR